MSKFFEGGSLYQQSGPEISIELFTLNKYLRGATAERRHQNVRFIEEMVKQNQMERFEEQKKNGGNRGDLDNSSDYDSDQNIQNNKSDSESESSEESGSDGISP